MKLRYASIRAKLLKECLRSAQLSESLQQDAFDRRPIRGQFRLRHQSRHPIALAVVALECLPDRAAARIAGFPGVLRFDAGRTDAQENGELVFAHGMSVESVIPPPYRARAPLIRYAADESRARPALDLEVSPTRLRSAPGLAASRRSSRPRGRSVGGFSVDAARRGRYRPAAADPALR